MDDRIARTIENAKSLDELAQFEINAKNKDALSDEVRNSIRRKSADLGRSIITERTGLQLTDLTPAEEKIVQAVSEYVGVMKRLGKDATRTFSQIKNRGLLVAAETSVAKSKPTQGFQTLVDADLSELSYEQIIIDHPEEFSDRAQWYARRTLGLQNESDKPPAGTKVLVQERTAKLLEWLHKLCLANDGAFPAFTNADAGTTLGMTDMPRYGRVIGNIQSRIDYACYAVGLPPLGLAAETPFEKAWGQEDRDWVFPVEDMQKAAQIRVWSKNDFDLILREAEQLPGLAHISWKKAFREQEASVKAWAFGLNAQMVPGERESGESVSKKKRNPDWSRDELILALDLYLRFRHSPPAKNGPEIIELSEFLGELAQERGISQEGTFRNANSVYMKIMNFRRFDPEHTDDGKVGLTRGNKNEEFVWDEFSSDPEALANAVTAIRASVAAPNELDIDAEEDGDTESSDAETLAQLAALEKRYRNTRPKMKMRVSRSIERGAIGAQVKKANDYKCQLCDALGLDPLGFVKRNGDPYVEAHHVMPVSNQEIGSLSASNIMTLCANHHRQMHYGNVEVIIEVDRFDLFLDGGNIQIPKITLGSNANKLEKL